LGCYGLR